MNALQALGALRKASNGKTPCTQYQIIVFSLNFGAPVLERLVENTEEVENRELKSSQPAPEESGCSNRLILRPSSCRYNFGTRVKGVVNFTR